MKSTLVILLLLFTIGVYCSEQNDYREAKLQRFMEWVSQGSSSLVGLKNYGEYGYGGYALRDIKEGESVIEVNQKLMITTSICENYPYFQHYTPLYDRFEYFYMFLVIDSQDKNSFWAPYYDILPTTFSTLYYFEEDELKLLEGLSIHANYLQTLNTLREGFAHAKLFVEKYYPKVEFTFERYLWAHHIVVTRCWGFAIEGKKGVELVPFADILNHDLYNGNLGSFNDSTFYVTAKIDYKMGDQVYISYGNKTNEEFLSGYGYTLPDNPYSRYDIFVSAFNSEDPLLSIIFSKLFENNFSRKVQLTRNLDTVEKDFISLFRVNFISNYDILDVFDIIEGNCSSISAEKKVYSQIISALETTLKNFPTTLQDDLDALADPTISFNKRNALTITKDIKEIIHLHIDYIKKKWLDIFRTGYCNGKKILD